MNEITQEEIAEMREAIERLSGIDPTDFGEDWVDVKFAVMDVDSLAVMGVAGELLEARGGAVREVFPRQAATPRALLDLIRHADQE